MVEGHAHFHVVAWLPKWCDYKRLHRWWAKALRKADSVIKVEWKTEVEKKHRGFIQFERFEKADGAIRYVTKACRYITKNSLELLQLSDPEAAAAILDYLYGKRQIAASVGFFVIVASEWELVGQAPVVIGRCADWKWAREIDGQSGIPPPT